MTMLEEIYEQADVVERLLNNNLFEAQELAELTASSTHVVIAARGTSDNAARYAQYVWGARNHLSVGLTTPSLFSLFHSPPSLADALVVGISQSGESPDLVDVLSVARREGRPIVTITNESDSPLAAQADLIIDLRAGVEAAVAATKTYTAQLTAVAWLSTAMRGDSGEVLADLPTVLRSALTAGKAAIAAVEGLVNTDRCIVVGRGFHQATIFEWALKLQELTYILAQPFSTADFLHGPVAAVEEGFPMIVVATAGPAYKQTAMVAAEMLDRGAHVITVTDIADTPGSHVVEVPTVDPWLSPIVLAPVLQQFTNALAEARGQDPDAPRGLSKVTRTR